MKKLVKFTLSKRIDIRQKILETLYQSGRKLESVLCRTRPNYTWPVIMQDIHKHIELCTNYFELQPIKSHARASGLPISLVNL